MIIYVKDEEENTSEDESNEFVERVSSMKIENLKEDWDSLFGEALELHPEDKK